MKIVLIGYRGSGKSTVGKILAEKLGLRYIGMDETIEKEAGLSIKEMVAQFGWEHFRALERALSRKLRDCKDCVIDTGGGAVMDEENARNLCKDAFVVYLKTSPSVIIDRIKSAQDRPPLMGEDFLSEVKEVLSLREPVYEALANLVISTDKLTPRQIAEAIIKGLGR